MLPRDDNEAFEIRASAGDGPECDVNPLDPRPLETPLPPVVPCDDPAAPAPEVFFTPEPVDEEPRSFALPAPLTIFSPEQDMTCPPGTVPDAEVEMPEVGFGALTRSIDLASIEVDGEPLFDQSTLFNLANVSGTIQTAVYDFLGETAPAQEPDRSAYIAAGLDAAIAEVVAITKLSVSVVTKLWDHILEQQAALDAAATALAARRKVCGYYNDDLWVVCYDRDAGADRVLLADPNDDTAVFISAGTVFSNSSVEEANRLAQAAAIGVLPCTFENVAQEVSCESAFGGDYSDDILFSWPTLDDPATTKLSDLGGHISLAGGTPTVVVPGEEFVTYDAVTAGGAGAVPRELVIKVVVPAGTTTATTQAEADSLARTLALTYLDCFIPSRERHLSCADQNVNPAAWEQTEAGGGAMTEGEVLSQIVTGYTELEELLPTIKPDNVTILPGPAIDERVAVRMTVPAGAFVSDSRLAADAASESYALAAAATLLDCNWRNRQMTYACDDNPEYEGFAYHLTDTLYLPNGVSGVTYPGEYTIAFKRGQFVVIPLFDTMSVSGLFELMASVDRSAPYSYETPRGEFESPNSQAEADRIAAAHAMSQLSCIYCNPRIDPICPPNGSEGDPLPLNPSDYHVYSFDATRGAPGLAYDYDMGATPPRWRIHSEGGEVPQDSDDPWYCSPDPQEAARVAVETGTTQLRTKERVVVCHYGNDAFFAACKVADLPGETEDDTHVTPDSVNSAYFSNSSTEGYVSLAADTVLADSKVAANAVARVIILSQLDCFFESPALKLYCGAGEDVEPLPDPSFFVEPGAPVVVPAEDPGFMDSDPTHPVSVRSNGSASSTGVAVPYGYGRSYISPRDAFDQAVSIGIGQLNCFWDNTEQSAACPTVEGCEDGSGVLTSKEDGYVSGATYSATVEANKIQSYQSQADADTIADLMAKAQLLCLYTNQYRTGDGCPPGETRIQLGVVPAGSIVSSVSMCDANDIADALANSLDVCTTAPAVSNLTSPFGVSATPGDGCCEINILPVIRGAIESKLWSPDDPASTTGDVPGYSEVSLTWPGGSFGCAPLFVYLEAYPQAYEPDRPLHSRYWATAGAVVVSAVELPLLVGTAPNFNTVRRLIAEVSGAEEDCSNVKIAQSVTTAQKIDTADMGDGNIIPVITDLDSPAPGEPTRAPFQFMTTSGGWKVSEYGSSIIDGSNGSMISISDLGYDLSLTGSIGVKILINSDYSASSATIESGFTQEVIYDSDGLQTEAWLYLGEVSLVGSTYQFKQSGLTAQLLDMGFVNGTFARCFVSHPPHPSTLT